MNQGKTSLTFSGYIEACISFLNMSCKDIIQCCDNYHGQPCFDFIMLRIGTSTIPSKVVGILEVERVKKFVVYTTEWTVTSYDGPNKMLETFFFTLF